MRTSSRPRSMSRSRSSKARSRAGRRSCGGVDDHAVDDPGQPGDRLRADVEYVLYAVKSDRETGSHVGRRDRLLIADRDLAEQHLVLSVQQRTRLSAAIERGRSCKRLRPSRHHRPPPDAQARRVLREAAPVPARRLRHHRPGHRPRPYGARPWRGRFRAVQGNGIDPVFAVDAGGFYRADGRGSAGKAASSTPSSTRPTGRSAPTCAKPARCSPRARTSSTATRIRGARRPRSSTAAPRNGSSRWTSR